MHIQNFSQKVWREGHFFPDLDLNGSVLLACIQGREWCSCVDRIHVVEDWFQRQALVNTLMNTLVIMLTEWLSGF